MMVLPGVDSSAFVPLYNHALLFSTFSTTIFFLF